MKKVRVVLSPEAKEVFEDLKKKAPDSKIEKGILKAVRQKIDLIKYNPHYGAPVGKKKIPKEFKEKYKITNMFIVELPSYWRMLYSLVDGETEIEIVAFVLNITDHPKYDKKFGYKKK